MDQELQLFHSCRAKQALLLTLFAPCTTPEQKYAKIIEMGRQLPPFPAHLKQPQYLVHGCQSQMYLHSQYANGKVFFQIHSDALISAGLGALLLQVYNEEPPEAVLYCAPDFLRELELAKYLSPGRSNGLASLLVMMKTTVLPYVHPEKK